MVFASGDKYMPEREGIRYHVISMQWVAQWKRYVDYERVCGVTQEESKTGTTTQASTEREVDTADAALTQNFHHGHKEG